MLPQYAGQGIGKAIMSHLETFISYMAAEHNAPEVVEVETAQLDVIKFMLAQGYDFSEDELVRFESTLTRLESNDTTLELRSDPAWWTWG